MTDVDPRQFIITRKRKKYKFALFHNSPLCKEADEWGKSGTTDILEMGSGTGLFSVAIAKAHPERNFVAFDIKADRLQTGARAATEAGLTNLSFLRARADLVEEYFAPHSLEKIWLTFPDPFSKDRSAKHRLLHPRFLKSYAKLLKKDGVLFFKTDAHDLFEWSLERLVEVGWRIEELTFDLHESDFDETYKIKTTYEARYVKEGKRIGFVKALPPN